MALTSRRPRSATEVARGLAVALVISLGFGATSGVPNSAAHVGSLDRPAANPARHRAAASFGHPCAESYGDFWLWPDYYDPEWDCLLELSAWDYADIINGVQLFESPCSDEAEYLYGANLYEWTGNYGEAYEWEAFINYDEGFVAMHWTSFGDWELWAHEGAHGAGYYDEQDAADRAYDCTYHIYYG